MFDFTLKRGDSGEPVRMIQKALNEDLQSNKPLKTDGDFGPSVQNALNAFQAKYELSVTGIYTESENSILGPVIDSRFLMDSDIDTLSEEADLPGDVMKAIRQVEGKSDGFYPDGRPIILFERHKFYKYLGLARGTAEQARVYKLYPDICNPTAGGYVGGTAEYDRLERATDIDSDAGYLSASYGMFQLMGFNFALGGYADVNEMVSSHAESEKNQFKAIVGFIKANPSLLRAVKNKDPVGIAKNYNGAAYSGYDKRIEAALKLYN